MNLKPWTRADRRFRRDDGGQAIVEFALVAPVLLLLIVGVIEFARAWNCYQVITDAAREAARMSVVANDASQAEVRQTVDQRLASAAMDPAEAEVSIEGFRTGRHTPATVTIQYPYQFTFLSRLMRAAGFPSSVTLRTQFVMRNE